MKNNIPFKKITNTNVGWNINDYHYVYKRNKRFNGKKYWLNIFNRRLRRYLKNLIRKGKSE